MTYLIIWSFPLCDIYVRYSTSIDIYLFNCWTYLNDVCFAPNFVSQHETLFHNMYIKIKEKVHFSQALRALKGELGRWIHNDDTKWKTLQKRYKQNLKTQRRKTQHESIHAGRSQHRLSEKSF